MASITVMLQRPDVRHSPRNGFGMGFMTTALNMPVSSGKESASPTDVYLSRSYDLLDQLRQAVAERRAER